MSSLLRIGTDHSWKERSGPEWSSTVSTDIRVPLAIAISMLVLALLIAIASITTQLSTPSDIYPSTDGRERAIAILKQLSSPRGGKTNVTILTMICCVIIFSEGFYITQIYPYLSFMTEALIGGTSGLGFRSGLLQSAPYFGMLLSSYGWGIMANILGRRNCLLISLLCNAMVAGFLVGVRQYWVAMALRTFGGLANCNYFMCYTMLKEGFQMHGVDHRGAFVRVSMAFTLSTVLGPTAGGLMYDHSFGIAAVTPWMLPMVCSCVLYMCAALSCSWLTDENPKPDEQSLHGSGSLSGWPFFCLMVMGGAISYVFIGWELGYPLLARVPRYRTGEAWSTDQIAMTFLCGSISLLAYSTFLFETILQTFSALRVWISGFIVSSIIMLVFPHLVYVSVSTTCTDLASNEPCRSPSVVTINAVAQIVVSICVGGNFVTMQLILNDFVSGLTCSRQALPIAQSVLQTVNAVVRSTAPLVTGFLFTISDPMPQTEHLIPFAHLAVVALVCCIGAAVAYTNLTANAEATLEKARKWSKENPSVGNPLNEPTDRARESTPDSADDLISLDDLILRARETSLESLARTRMYR